uniref:ABC-2 type transporter transmembrane domain-containing protein n=1 Tax=Phytophthora ramorum TaxID=164328 RepID=H3GUN5_PHYRM
MVFANKRAATQMKSVVNRFFQMNWRTPIHNITLMILAIILVLLFSSVFIDTEYASFFGINSDLSVSLFLSMTGFQSVLSRTCSKRASFYRERASRTVRPTRPHPPHIGVHCTGNLFKR